MKQKVFVPDIVRMRRRNEKIVMLTAYDFPTARILDEAGVDIILVGDSLGTVIQGHQTTLSVTVEDIIYHSRAVMRGCQRALVVADMPFMSYQLGPKEALAAAGRLVKETGVSAVKLEGGIGVSEAIKRIVDADIPVMGHIGLTPQSYHRMGGHRIQGKERGVGPGSASRLFEDANAVQEAGAFSVVLEGIPSELASKITEALTIPTIGIGAGVSCSGQVLVVHDLLGVSQQVPKFVKKYANLDETIRSAVGEFIREVRSEEFPAIENSYQLPREESEGTIATANGIEKVIEKKHANS